MAKQTLPSGGTVYYGNSNSSIDPSAADFSTGMNALTGATGHITVSYVTPVITIKYDWMTTGHIAQIIHNTTSTEGFEYTIYVSDYGDVFADFLVSNSPRESPEYDSRSTGSVYRWNSATSGTTDVIRYGLSIFKLNSTDVRSTSERFIFAIPSDYGILLFPDSVASGSTNDTDVSLDYPLYTNAKFTVLGPIYSSKSSGVTTYARRFDGITTNSPVSIAGGAYTIGGYRYQVINNGHRSPIALANSDS